MLEIFLSTGSMSLAAFLSNSGLASFKLVQELTDQKTKKYCIFSHGSREQSTPNKTGLECLYFLVSLDRLGCLNLG